MKNRASFLAFSVATCSLLLLATPVSGQGSFVTYGQGCPGSVSGRCAANNGNTTQPLQWKHNSFRFALKVPTSPRAVVVDGFELYTKTVFGTSTVNTYLFSESGGKPSSLMATGTMKIGTTLGFYRTTFSAPVSIAPNTVYYLVYKASGGNMYFPFVTTGTLATHFYEWQTGKWSGPWTTNAWAWRVNCKKDPQISCQGVPTIGQWHVIHLTNAKANAQAFLALGTARFSLPFPGAPDCFLLNNVAALFPISTDASGNFSLREDVPKDSSLRGTKWPHQFAVIDSVNAAGIVFSAGGEVRL